MIGFLIEIILTLQVGLLLAEVVSELCMLSQNADTYAYAPDEVPNDSFDTVGGSFLATFVIMTSENWPTVFLPAYKASESNAFIFLPAVGMLNQIILGALLGLVWNSWENNFKRQVCR